MRAVLTLLATLLCTPATAQPILDAAAVPMLSDAGRSNYRAFLLTNLPRAFALSSNGVLGWQGGTGTLETARAKALAGCKDNGATDCAIYAENLDVVWKGRAATPNAPPAALISTLNLSIDPDARYVWRGPAAAKGVHVRGHGFAPCILHFVIDPAPRPAC